MHGNGHLLRSASDSKNEHEEDYANESHDFQRGKPELDFTEDFGAGQVYRKDDHQDHGDPYGRTHTIPGPELINKSVHKIRERRSGVQVKDTLIIRAAAAS